MTHRAIFRSPAAHGILTRAAACLSFLVAIGLGAPVHASEPQMDLPRTRLQAGMHQIDAQVAATPMQRSIGLMFRKEMPQHEGMLFVFEQPAPQCFWMRNTLIPLDMLFADPAGRITHIHENAVPLDETTIDGGEGVQFILEINGGMASRLGIAVGDVMQHPSMGPDAALPCE